MDRATKEDIDGLVRNVSDIHQRKIELELQSQRLEGELEGVDAELNKLDQKKRNFEDQQVKMLQETEELEDTNQMLEKEYTMQQSTTNHMQETLQKQKSQLLALKANNNEKRMSLRTKINDWKQKLENSAKT
jgi:chromosome segregation ATPase